MARIYQTPSMGDAKICVAIVTNQGEADLLVCRVSSWGMANGDALWFITRDPQSTQTWVYFSSEGISQVKVCFVDSMGSAGWIDRGQAAMRYRGCFA